MTTSTFDASGAPLALDGAYGEGGGQILRTALSLSLITCRPIRIVNLRAGRAKPGLRPQHLCALRAAALVGDAIVSGDALGSTEISFAPAHAVKPGDYTIDVAGVTERGSAGAMTLILQTLLAPLAMAHGRSKLKLLGGTHVPWSPPFDGIARSYLPALRAMGFDAKAHLVRWGWYPVGQGEIVCEIIGNGRCPHPYHMTSQGTLQSVEGRAVVSNVPIGVAERMAETAAARLSDLHVPIHVGRESVDAACAGAGLFLTARYDNALMSFSALGERGKPAEAVAADAAAALIDHHVSGAAVETHLADQLLLPLALASGPSTFTTPKATQHLMTNMWAIEQFGVATMTIEPTMPVHVHVRPR